MTSDDDQLSAAVTAAQLGDDDAFRLLYRSAHPLLQRYLWVLVGDDAEDVASETWLQIVRDLPSFRGDYDGFRGWAATIARHRALDHIRRRQRRPMEVMPIEHLADASDNHDAASLAVDSIATRRAIALIAKLPPDQAEAVMLRVVMGLDANGAGHVLGKASWGRTRGCPSRATAPRSAARGQRFYTYGAIRRREVSNASGTADAEEREMSEYQQTRPEDAAGQQMPETPRTCHHSAPGALTNLLRAASAPAGLGPLPGEQFALDAFRVAHLDNARQQPSMIHALLAKLLTVKAAAAIGGVALAGGVAFAAGTGAIPNPLRQPAPTAPATPAVPPQVSPVPTETPAAIGLCQAYLADPSRSTLDAPALQTLIAKAAGKDHISTYCTQLIAVTSVHNGATPNPADPTPGRPTTTPSPTRPGAATPTPSHPTAAPTPTPTHPTGPATPGRG